MNMRSFVANLMKLDKEHIVKFVNPRKEGNDDFWQAAADEMQSQVRGSDDNFIKWAALIWTIEGGKGKEFEPRKIEYDGQLVTLDHTFFERFAPFEINKKPTQYAAAEDFVNEDKLAENFQKHFESALQHFLPPKEKATRFLQEEKEKNKPSERGMDKLAKKSMFAEHGYEAKSKSPKAESPKLEAENSQPKKSWWRR